MLNSVNLVGRLTKDVDLSFTPNGNAVGKIVLAVQRNYKNEQGEYEADFFLIEAWRTTAENLANYCKKGSLVSVDGVLRSERYQKNGEMQYITKVVAESIVYLDPKNNESEKPIVDEEPDLPY